MRWYNKGGMKKLRPPFALFALTLLSCSAFSSSSSKAISYSSGGITPAESSLSKEADSSSETISSSEVIASSSDSISIPQRELALSDFFDHHNKANITISASKEVFTFLSAYQGEKDGKYNDAYLPADIHIELLGQHYDFPCSGIRVKGNTSRAHFFERGKFTKDVHFKLNFKATFDGEIYNNPLLSSYKVDWSEDAAGRKTRKDRNFLGLEKLDIKYIPRNTVTMPGCLLREIYCYDAFRDEGIMAPYANLAHVTLSTGEESVDMDYEVIETIDKEFLKRRYSKDEAKGNLYKCVYNGMGKADLTRDGAVDKSTGERVEHGKIGVEDNYNRYVPVYQLKTNDDLGEGSDFSDMASFIMKLRDCVYETDQTIEDLEAILDVDQFLKMSAVSYLLGNFDDQRYDYNNYYLYFRPSDNKAVIIPYDWDWSLGLDLSGRMAGLAPLENYTYDGGTVSNLYLATLFGTDSTSYSQEAMKSTYLSYVLAAKDTVLKEEKYRAFAEIFGYSNHQETRDVLSYMSAKRIAAK